LLVDFVSIALRAFGFIAIFQAGGAAIFLALFGGQLGASRLTIRRVGLLAAVAAVVFLFAHNALEPARLAGEFAGMWDPALQKLLEHSSAHAAFVARAAGVGLVLLGLITSNRHLVFVALIGTALLAASFALTGHTTESPLRWALSIALVAHLLAVAFWFGGLVPLYLVSSRESLAQAAAIIERYSRLASRIVPLLFVAGVLLAMFLMESVADLLTPYGAIILGKVVLFAVLMGLATLNKWRFGPAMTRGEAPASVAFRRSVLAELVLIALVLAMTATLTSLYSPH
jgi:copper resistance protein D